jgi:hypothetical protein
MANPFAVLGSTSYSCFGMLGSVRSGGQGLVIKAKQMSQDDLQRTPIVRRLTRRLEGFISVDEAIVTYPRYDGEQATVTRLSVERGDSVAVLAVDPDKRTVWLAEQFRYPTLAKGPGWLTEVAAGQIDALEEPEANEALAKQLRDEDEDIQILEQDLDAFLADAFAGRICDAKTLIAAYWLDKHRQRLQL